MKGMAVFSLPRPKHPAPESERLTPTITNMTVDHLGQGLRIQTSKFTTGFSVGPRNA